MWRISVLGLFVAACWAQPGKEIMAGATSSKSGVTFRFRSMLLWNGVSQNGVGAGLGEGGVRGLDNGMARWMVDNRRKTYFGYDLVIRTGKEPGTLLALFQPPSKSWTGTMVDHDGNALKPLPLPVYPQPMVVHDGDTVALDLMVSPDGRQKLTDYIEILARKPEPKPAATTLEPRDFTVDDGPVAFDPMFYTIWIQGEEYSGESGFTTKPGATFWIGLPGQGRYILSLAPRAGLVLSGAIRDNVVWFRDGGQEYEVRFLSPIAGAGKAWRLYMMRDPTYEPKPELRDWVVMGTDRLENLLPKQ